MTASICPSYGYAASDSCQSSRLSEEARSARAETVACRVGELDRYSPPKGVDMPKLVITHAVQDIERWLQGKAERAAAIESGSGSNVTDYVAQDGSKNIAITADVADVDAMKSMLATPPAEVVARMEAHGVVQPLTVYIES